jgi:single-strand DNA-binding protein
MSLNEWTAIGNLVADPEAIQTQKGTSMCKVRVAVGRDYKREGAPESDFFTLTAIGANADFILKYFTKGMPMAFKARIENNKYTDQNGKDVWSTNYIIQKSYFCGYSKNSDATNNKESASTQTASVKPTPAKKEEKYEPIDPPSDEDLPF